MAFRDGYEAAIQRAAALQRDLEEARSKSDADERQVAELASKLAEVERERDQLRVELGDSAEPAPAQADSPVGDEPDSQAKGSRWIVVLMVGAAIVLGGWCLAATTTAPESPSPGVNMEYQEALNERLAEEMGVPWAARWPALCRRACMGLSFCQGTTGRKVDQQLCTDKCTKLPRGSVERKRFECVERLAAGACTEAFKCVEGFDWQ